MTRNRVLALAIVGAFLGLLRWLAPEPAARAVWLLLVALPLGYGHVIGAAVFARARIARAGVPRGSRVLAGAFTASLLLTLAILYTRALGIPALQPFMLGSVLLLFGWHIVENDLALGCAHARGLRLGPVARGIPQHALALALTLLVALAAFSTPEGALFSQAYVGATPVPVQTWLSLDEITAAFLLYHTLAWLLFFGERVRALRASAAREAARLRRRVLAFHLLPLPLNAALYALAPEAYAYVAAPSLYFFWSALHALHTAWVRGIEARPSPA